MSEESRRVLDLLAQGKITVDEADRLLQALGAAAGPAAGGAAPQTPSGGDGRPAAAGELKYVRINVHKTRHDGRPDKDVNIRVPVAFVRSGVRLGSLIPGFPGDEVSARLREKGFDPDFSKLDGGRLDRMLRELSTQDIEIDSGKARVRISCE